MSDPELTDTWILGLNFFRDHYVEFNTDKRTVKVLPVSVNVSTLKSHVVTLGNKNSANSDIANNS